MLEYVGLLASIVCMVCSGLFFVINFMAQQPTKIKVDNISEKQKEVAATQKAILDELKNEEVLIQGIGEKAASAHKRLDEYEMRLREVESRCNTCAVCNRKE